MITALGRFSKARFLALLTIRETALHAVRTFLKERGFQEVTTSSLVNIAGSCENPHASFSLNYYGRQAHLSQSAQLQLEALVLRLNKRFFTVNNSFREEHFDDPEAKGRRLSEFTLIEPEMPMQGLSPDEALSLLIQEIEDLVKTVVRRVVEFCEPELGILGADIPYLKGIIGQPFVRITYDDALNILNHGALGTLNKKGTGGRSFEDDLGIAEERFLLRHFNNVPLFISGFPAELKFFNIKRLPDGVRTWSVDLLTPCLGETIGGAVREEHGDVILTQLETSAIGKFLKERGIKPQTPFAEYFEIFRQEPQLLRAGFGIGFERLVGFLLNSNDILETISYRTLQP